MKKRIRTIIGIIVGIIIGISTTVGAATIFNSKDITYSNSATSKTNVKDSLDELYTKVGKCPEGFYCYTEPLGLSDKIEIGDYIRMTPTLTSYTIDKNLTGYTSDQTINPSELNLWRVIRKNDDGTVDVVSEYVSSNLINIYGNTGYKNFVGLLNNISEAYKNDNYVESTRHMGYNGQKLFCTEESLIYCRDNAGYEIDINLVQIALDTLIAKNLRNENKSYWLASRSDEYSPSGSKFYFKRVDTNGSIKNVNLTYSEGIMPTFAIRPILTLKSSSQIKSGDGKSSNTAFEFS